jgi:hypothetical protein
MHNHAIKFTTVALSLENEADVQMEVYSSTGKLVASRSYGKMNGAYTLPINTEEFAKGIYFVKVLVDGKPSVMKLIKE